MARAAKKAGTTAALTRDTYHHGDLKRALTDAALELVQEKGPKGFTLREVARRAGVSPAAPYRHFPHKSHLVATAATRGFELLHEALDASVADTDGLAERIVAIGTTYVRWAITHPDYYQVMFGSDLDKTEHPEVLTAGLRAFRGLLDAITRCQEAGVLGPGEPLTIAGPIWSLMHGVSMLSIDGDLPHVGIVEDPADMVARSLRAMLF